MGNVIIRRRSFWEIMWQDLKELPGKAKRLIWNRGIKLQWYRLWVREDEAHQSLDMDILALLDMNPQQREAYMWDLVRRRQISHERDIERRAARA